MWVICNDNWHADGLKKLVSLEYPVVIKWVKNADCWILKKYITNTEKDLGNILYEQPLNEFSVKKANYIIDKLAERIRDKCLAINLNI